MDETEKFINHNPEFMDNLKSSKNKNFYFTLRDNIFGTMLSSMQYEDDHSLQEKIQNDIEFLKSLDLISNQYIDNLVIYFEVLKKPILNHDYLCGVIDSYIKPPVSKSEENQLFKIIVSFITYHCTKNKQASMNTTSKALAEYFGIADSPIRKNARKLKKAYEKWGQKNDIFYILEFIVFLSLYYYDFEIDKVRLGEHHNTLTEINKFKKAYQKFCNSIIDRDKGLVKDFFDDLPEHLVPSFNNEFISKVKKNTDGDFDTSEVAGILYARFFVTYLPNLYKDPEKIKHLCF